jgi:hypothetical protein
VEKRVAYNLADKQFIIREVASSVAFFTVHASRSTLHALWDDAMKILSTLSAVALRYTVAGVFRSFEADRPQQGGASPRCQTSQLAGVSGERGWEVKLQGSHEIKAMCSICTNVAKVYHDGKEIGSGWPLLESTYAFEVQEEGERVEYAVVIRGPGLSAIVKPYYTITRNGTVLVNDR